MCQILHTWCTCQWYPNLLHDNLCCVSTAVQLATGTVVLICEVNVLCPCLLFNICLCVFGKAFPEPKSILAYWIKINCNMKLLNCNCCNPVQQCTACICGITGAKCGKVLLVLKIASRRGRRNEDLLSFLCCQNMVKRF